MIPPTRRSRGKRSERLDDTPSAKFSVIIRTIDLFEKQTGIKITDEQTRIIKEFVSTSRLRTGDKILAALRSKKDLPPLPKKTEHAQFTQLTSEPLPYVESIILTDEKLFEVFITEDRTGLENFEVENSYDFNFNFSATADDGRATAAEAALRPADDEQQSPVGTWTTTHAAEEEEEEEDEEREWRSVAEAVDAGLDRDEGCCWADKSFSLSLASCLMAHFDHGGIAGVLGGRHQQLESFPLTNSEDSALRDGY